MEGFVVQKEKAKREPHWRPSLAKFLVGWVLIWWLALLVFFFFDFSSRYLSPDNAIEFALYKAVFFAFLSALQMLWVRRQLRVRLQYWIPLALLGALAGTIAFLLLDTYVLGPHLPMYYSELWGRPVPEVVRIIRLEYAADYVAHGTLLWSLPVIFQWAALRKHFRRHALWLLAALAHNPFTLVTIDFFLSCRKRCPKFIANWGSVTATSRIPPMRPCCWILRSRVLLRGWRCIGFWRRDRTQAQRSDSAYFVSVAAITMPP